MGRYEFSVRSEPAITITRGGDARGRYALLAAAGDYPLGTDNDLATSQEDLQQIRSMLVERFGFDKANMLELRDARVTRGNIIRGFREFLSQAGEDGMVVFYYSGHGLQIGENLPMGAQFDMELDYQDDGLYLEDSSVLMFSLRSFSVPGGFLSRGTSRRVMTDDTLFSFLSSSRSRFSRSRDSFEKRSFGGG